MYNLSYGWALVFSEKFCFEEIEERGEGVWRFELMHSGLAIDKSNLEHFREK